MVLTSQFELARKRDSGTPVERLLTAVRCASRSVLILNHEGLLPHQQYAATRPQLAIISRLRDLHLGGSTRVILFTDRYWKKVANCLGCTPSPEIWGVGGLERVTPDGEYDGPKIDEIQTSGLAEAYEAAGDLGLQAWVEKKPGGLGLYLNGFAYDDVVALGGRLWGPWSRIANTHNLQITGLKHGIELRVPGRTREQAIETILSELPPETPVAYVGTDVLDEIASRPLRGRGLIAYFGAEHRTPHPDVYVDDWEQMISFLDQLRSEPPHDCVNPPRTDLHSTTSAQPGRFQHKEKFDEASQGPHHARRSIATRRVDRLCSKVPAT